MTEETNSFTSYSDIWVVHWYGHDHVVLPEKRERERFHWLRFSTEKGAAEFVAKLLDDGSAHLENIWVVRGKDLPITATVTRKYSDSKFGTGEEN